MKSGDHTIQTFVVYPESSRKTPVVLVIHENMGLTDWVRSLADQLAEAGYIAVAGFCWGGGNSFRFATNRSDLKAAFVFYGTGPEAPDAIARIKAPVYGFYGGNDARVNATIAKSEELTKEAHKTYQPVIYEGAGHGFMRAGEDPAGTEPNRKARSDAWIRWKALLEKL